VLRGLPREFKHAQFGAFCKVPLHSGLRAVFKIDDKYLKRAGLDYWQFVYRGVSMERRERRRAKASHASGVRRAAHCGVDIYFEEPELGAWLKPLPGSTDRRLNKKRF